MASNAFHRGFNRLTPETLKAINNLVVQAAVELGLEDGQRLRVDTTVVQTDMEAIRARPRRSSPRTQVHLSPLLGLRG
ncbi:hypothetical protein KIP88_45695, partial [Bradyrhizobium sp. SRL28]|uniref:hypothetical protein n=1 Tax=Bradyrhizobium sp. SRL28 TaxID=2836178 RepID=UPI001BDEB311